MTIDYAGESRQLRTEGSGFIPTFLLSAILIYLVLIFFITIAKTGMNW